MQSTFLNTGNKESTQYLIRLDNKQHAINSERGIVKVFFSKGLIFVLEDIKIVKTLLFLKITLK